MVCLECRAAKRETRRLERAVRWIDLGDATAVAAAKAAWITQRRAYIILRHQKRENFWRIKVDAESQDPHQLWRSVDALLGRSRVPPCDAISAVAFHGWSVTADATPPSFTRVPSCCSLVEFQRLTPMTSSLQFEHCQRNNRRPICFPHTF